MRKQIPLPTMIAITLAVVIVVSVLGYFLFIKSNNKMDEPPSGTGPTDEGGGGGGAPADRGGRRVTEM